VRSSLATPEPIYFTFDDGPDPTWTPRVMDVLARYGARGTFFMVGQDVEPNSDVVRRLVQAGDYAADHTWEHESLAGVSQQEFVQSVGRTRDVLVNTASDLFTLDGSVAHVRPPYGETDESTRAYAADLGMSVVMWDVDPMDWREPGAQEFATYVLDNAYSGAIVLMHDGGGDRSQTVAALETILPALTAQGYTFPTVFDGDPTARVVPAAPPGAPSAGGPVATPAPPANPNAWHVVGTGGTGANVREEPSTSATVLAVLPDGTEVQPLEGPVECDGLRWLKVRSAASPPGWVAADLLQPPQKGSTSMRPKVTLPQSPAWVVAGTDGAGANVRALPSTESEVVAVLAEGAPVQPLEGRIAADGTLWRKVHAEDADGWTVASCVPTAVGSVTGRRTLAGTVPAVC
jgi:peptidoglycan/xylan/chitin deacetylase (PgdA/CDA1 family)